MGTDLQIEEDDPSQYDDTDEKSKFISPSSRTEVITVTHFPPSSSTILPIAMSDHQQQKCEEKISEPVNVAPAQEKKSEGHHEHGKGGRKSSIHSIKSCAHVQLQMLVEDVKDFAHGNNNNNSTDKNNAKNAVCDNKKKSLTEKGEKEKKERTGWRRYIGIILGITSSMFFALAILIVKIMAEQYHPYSVTFWRFQGVLLPAIPVAFYFRVIKKQRIFDAVACTAENRKTLFFVALRCVTGASAVVLQFYSLQFINMADSSVIAFSTPVFVSLAASVLLGEKSGFIPVICGVITLLGVTVITRPPMLTGGDEFDTNTLIGAGLALGCMFCAASTFLLLRYLRQLHFSVITVLFGCWGSFQSLALSASISRFQAPEGLEHWMLAIALALLTFLGQTCITLAFKFEQAGTVSLCRTFDILFAYVWQFIFLGVVPDIYSFIGGGIVIIGVLLAAFRKFLTDLPPESPTRKAFWIILK